LPHTGIIRRFEARLARRPRHGPVAARVEFFHFLRRLVALLAAITAMVLVGGALLAVAEDNSYWHGILWALDTIATIGSIPEPDSMLGQLTKVGLIVFGVGTMFFVLVTLTELFVAGDLTGLLERHRLDRQIAHLEQHFLICGFGRVGQQIARDLLDGGVPFVVIDDNPDVREVAEEMGVLLVEGRGSEDDVLAEAGIQSARGVIACVDSDAENIFVTLTARERRPDIPIVARAARDSSEPKLIRAGANEVVSPYKASGRTMASLALGGHHGGLESEQERERAAVTSGPAVKPPAPSV
jgi:voltage-gated potassium channel